MKNSDRLDEIEQKLEILRTVLEDLVEVVNGFHCEGDDDCEDGDTVAVKDELKSDFTSARDWEAG